MSVDGCHVLVSTCLGNSRGLSVLNSLAAVMTLTMMEPGTVSESVLQNRRRCRCRRRTGGCAVRVGPERLGPTLPTPPTLPRRPARLSDVPAATAAVRSPVSGLRSGPVRSPVSGPVRSGPVRSPDGWRQAGLLLWRHRLAWTAPLCHSLSAPSSIVPFSVGSQLHFDTHNQLPEPTESGTMELGADWEWHDGAGS